MGAWYDVELYVVRLLHFAPPQFAAIGVLSSKQIGHLAWIWTRIVTRDRPNEYRHPVLPERSSRWEQREPLRMVFAPAPHESVRVLCVLVACPP